MAWFVNMKIGKKLMTAFGFMAVLAWIIGGIGSYGINDLRIEMEEVNENNTKPIANIGSWLEKYASLKVVMRDALISEDPEYLQARLERFNELKGEMEVALDEYSKGISSEEERQLYEALVEKFGQYLPLMEDAMADAVAGEKAEARDHIYNQAPELNTAVNETGRAILAINMKLADEALVENERLSQWLIGVMIVSAVVGAAIALAIGALLTRLVSRPIQEIVAASQKMAEGDMNVDIEVRSKDELGTLAQSFTAMANSMNSVLQNIANASEQVASGSRQVSEASQTLSQGSTEQASSIQQLTASIEQIASQTKLNAENAEEANRLALSAHADAELGNERMKEMLAAMEQINDSSGNISKIIKVIDEIAFQTNILALNAAVEAARAGQHGKGFAVVAEEVRNLAARSAGAAKETTVLIEGSIKKVEVGTKIATETARALDQIVGGVNKAASLVGSIAVSSNEQAIGIAQVNQGISQVSEVIQANSATSEECAAASEQLSGQSEQLKRMVGQFRLKRAAGEPGRGVVRNPAHLRSLAEAGQLEAAAATAGKTRIVLDEGDFGKYE